MVFVLILWVINTFLLKKYLNVGKNIYICINNNTIQCMEFKINMLQKTNNLLGMKDHKVLLTFIMLISCFINYSQITITQPILGFSQVCASPTFNNYSLTFSFSPVSNLGSGNIFTIQLSDSSGSFNNPTTLTTTSATTSPVNVSFAFPTDINGSYKIRVKSSAPSSISSVSNEFSANYAVYNNNFTINNGVSSQAVCSSSNFVLSIDAGENSPLQFPQLTYKWFKNGNLILNETGPNLTITQSGVYYVSVDYGSCSLNAYSNNVTITYTQSQTETLTINSPGNVTNICPTTGLLLTSTIAGTGYTYIWYQNGVSIPDAGSATYNVTEAGTYYLVVYYGGCAITSNTLTFTEDSITASLDTGTETNILPGQIKTLTATTNAISPTYTWYKDGGILTGQNQNTLDINEPGVYKVIVTQTSGCPLEKEVSTIVSAPTSYDLTIKNSSGYAECENNSETLSIDLFKYNSSLGNFDVPTSIPLTYKWYKGSQIVGTNSSYTVTSNVDNGDYTLEIIFSDGQIITSNEINVKLKINETLTISSDGGYLCLTNTKVVLSSSVTNPIYTYEWFESSSSTVLGTNTTYDATQVGNYYLIISYNGCELISNNIVVENIDDDLMMTNYDSTILINEGEEITIIASGMDSYQWIIEGNIVNITAELTISKESEIELIGTYNGCEISKFFTINFNPKAFNIVVPNTITPNNDGKNDTWIITEEFSYKNDVEIVIFSSNQQIVFRTYNYQNNWPIEPIVKNNRIFYYKILKDNSTLQQGTISVIQ